MAGTKASKSKKQVPAKASNQTNTKAGSVATGNKKDTVAIIRNFLAGMHEMGKESVAESLVLHETGYARTDSTGYRKAMKILVKELQHVEKVHGDSKSLRLTQTGRKVANPNAGSARPLKTNADVQNGYQERILKMGKKVPEKALTAIWNVLLDTSKTHTREELMLAAGYKRLDSTGFREVMKWLKQLKLTENGPSKGTVQFVIEKVFPFGVSSDQNTTETGSAPAETRGLDEDSKEEGTIVEKETEEFNKEKERNGCKEDAKDQISSGEDVDMVSDFEDEMY